MPTRLEKFLNGDPKGNTEKDRAGRKTDKGQSYTINTMQGFDHWMVNSDDMDEFYKLYYADLLNGVPMYYTERCTQIGQLRVDLDMKYAGIIDEHKHTQDQIIAFTKAYIEEVGKLVEVKQNLEIYVLEKDNPTPDKDKATHADISASGVHIQIPAIKTRPSVEETVRRILVPRMSEFFPNLDLLHDWNKVYDPSPLNHNGHWPILGSKKNGDGKLPYKIRYVLDWDHETGEISVDSSVPPIPTLELIRKLSTRSTPSEETPLTEEGKVKCRAPKQSDSVRAVSRGRSSTRDPDNPPSRGSSPGRQYTEPLTDTRRNYIQAHVDNLKSERYTDYKLWIDVGMCLKNIHPELESVFQDFSAKVGDGYDQAECMRKWDSFGFRVEGARLSEKSLRYWSREDNFTNYEKIEKNNVDRLIEEAASSVTEYDVALVVNAMFRDDFRCASYTNNDWYYYVDHIWKESQKGVELLRRLSSDVARQFRIRKNIEGAQLENLACSHKEYDSECDACKAEKREKQFATVVTKLKTTAFKSNIMRECQAMFYDPNFNKKLDENKHLIAFNNGVFDTLTREFRPGMPEDYISFCTGIDYAADTQYHEFACWSELKKFLHDILPHKNVREYFLKHLATCLSGVFNQRFHILTGSGSNGKSMLMNLCATAFGEYCYKANIAMFTQKRGKAGAANPELVRMKGKRFVMMSEPDEGEPLSSGFMKEMTSSEKVTGRDLFQGSKQMVEFDIQAKMHLACNEKPKVTTNDNGTWRRLKVVDFPNKFVNDPKAPNELPMDESIMQKVLSREWAECFMAYLVHLFKEGKGLTKLVPPAEVEAYTNEYKEESDGIAKFMAEYFHAPETPRGDEPEEGVHWATIQVAFTQWKRENESRASGVELRKRIEAQYGVLPKNSRSGWTNFQFGTR
jgi:P4 family phage/plasmid primase-like protien